MNRPTDTLKSSSDEQSRIAARWLSHLEDCLGEDGAACFSSALSQAGVPREALAKGKDLKIHQLEEAVRFARKVHPDIRLRLMKSLQPADIGIMGFAAMSSDRIDKAIEITLSWHELTSSRFSLELALEEETSIISPNVNPRYFHELVDIAEDSLAGGWRLLQLFLGAGRRSEFHRASVHFEHSKPNYAEVYEEAFRCQCHFDSTNTELRFPSEWLSLPVATANPAVAELCRSMCERISGPPGDRSTATDEVTRLLLSQGNRRILALEEAARRIHLSSSQLRKRLYREGTSYKRVVADTRMALARHYLHTSHLTIQNIAYLLDYSEAAAFTRAFKREIGVSPQEYRRRSSDESDRPQSYS